MLDFLRGYFTALQHTSRYSSSQWQVSDYISIFSASVALISGLALVYIGFISYKISKSSLQISSSAADTAKNAYTLSIRTHIQNQKSTWLSKSVEVFKDAVGFPNIYNHKLKEFTTAMAYYSALNIQDNTKRAAIDKGMLDLDMNIKKFVRHHQSVIKKPIDEINSAIIELIKCDNIDQVDSTIDKIALAEVLTHQNRLDCDRLIRIAEDALQHLKRIESTL